MKCNCNLTEEGNQKCLDQMNIDVEAQSCITFMFDYSLDRKKTKFWRKIQLVFKMRTEISRLFSIKTW